MCPMYRYTGPLGALQGNMSEGVYEVAKMKAKNATIAFSLQSLSSFSLFLFFLSFSFAGVIFQLIGRKKPVFWPFFTASFVRFVFKKSVRCTICKRLTALNPPKACSPDEIPNCMLKEYSECLSLPISRIINLSLSEQSLPKIWKFADVSPLPKVKPVEDLKKQLMPISLTPRLSKVAEECVILDYVKPAVLDVLDPSQYGAVPNSSTTQALIHMLHNWSKETDGNGATV